MKTIAQKAAGLVLVLLSVNFSLIQCSEGTGMEENLLTGEALLKAGILEQQLTEQEATGILFMREEEKLARDVYRHLYKVFPLRPFLNISKSEQAHMDAIYYLIETYGLEDPVGENPEGVFRNEDLQELYDQLIETGSQSREEALKVGALIEEVDIIDLKVQLEQSANDDVTRVYTNLCKASEAHLRAFVRVLKRYGVDYEPVELDQDTFDSILTAK